MGDWGARVEVPALPSLGLSYLATSSHPEANRSPHFQWNTRNVPIILESPRIFLKFLSQKFEIKNKCYTNFVPVAPSFKAETRFWGVPSWVTRWRDQIYFLVYVSCHFIYEDIEDLRLYPLQVTASQAAAVSSIVSQSNEENSFTSSLSPELLCQKLHKHRLRWHSPTPRS